MTLGSLPEWAIQLEASPERVQGATRVLDEATKALASGNLDDETKELAIAAGLLDRLLEKVDPAEAGAFLRLRRRFNRAADRVLGLLGERPAPSELSAHRVVRLVPHLPIRCAGRAGTSWARFTLSRAIFPVGWLAIPSLLLGWYPLPIGLAAVTAVEWWLMPRLAVTAVGLFVDGRRIPLSEIRFCRPHQAFVELVTKDGEALELPDGPVERGLREAGVTFV